MSKSDDLNVKQRAFVNEFLLDLNASKAAERAGYSKKTAPSQASRLLKNVKVAAEIDKALAARAERTQIDADWLLKRLADEAEADVADLYDDDGNLLPVKQWPKIWRKGLVAGMDIQVLEGSGDTLMAKVVKLKISDRVRRLELIGKHVNVMAFAERLLVDDTDRATILGRARERVNKGD